MYIVIFVTTKNVIEANKIAKSLVSQKLIACANIIKGVTSVFWWDNKAQQASECLLVIKSRKSLFPKIAKAVKSLHSYSVPEVIALPIIAGNKEYLNWVKDSTK